jgi:hypothetical protein
MAIVGILGACMEVSEAYLVGTLCGMVSLFGTEPIFDIEVSMFSKPNLLPTELTKSWTLRGNIQLIYNFYKTLGTGIGTVYLQAHAIFSSKIASPQKYYLAEKYHGEFMSGYVDINGLIKTYVESPNINYADEPEIDYKDDWSPDSKFLENSTLVTVPSDGVNKIKLQGLKIAAYVWDLPKITNTHQEQLTANLVGLFLRDCSNEDHIRLMDKKSYLRFHLYQDGPDTLPQYCPYVYGYIRHIDDCTYQSHKDILYSIPHDKLPCEINISKTGFFYIIASEEWKDKSIKHIERID